MAAERKDRFWKGCKPNSVPLLNGENHLSAQLIPETRSAFAETGAGRSGGFLFGLAPDGVFRAASLTLRAVRSYRTFSPSPPVRAGGCLFSVALSVEVFVPRPRVSSWVLCQNVTRHRALWCSDFPLPARAGSDSPPFQNRLHLTAQTFKNQGESGKPKCLGKMNRPGTLLPSRQIGLP
jgi:hypothetical protein